MPFPPIERTLNFQESQFWWDLHGMYLEPQELGSWGGAGSQDWIRQKLTVCWQSGGPGTQWKTLPSSALEILKRALGEVLSLPAAVCEVQTPSGRHSCLSLRKFWNGCVLSSSSPVTVREQSRLPRHVKRDTLICASKVRSVDLSHGYGS